MCRWVWNDSMQIVRMNNMRPGTKSKQGKSSQLAVSPALPSQP